MIAIDATLFSNSDSRSSVNAEFQPAIDPNIPDEIEFQFLKQNSQKIENFLRSCIDQQLILNTVWIGMLDDQSIPYNSRYITRYFATTSENAQAFQEAFINMDAEFSMKKMWAQHGLSIFLKQSEIYFDLVEDNFDLISEDGKIWGIDFKI